MWWLCRVGDSNHTVSAQKFLHIQSTVSRSIVMVEKQFSDVSVLRLLFLLHIFPYTQWNIFVEMLIHDLSLWDKLLMHITSVWKTVSWIFPLWGYFLSAQAFLSTFIPAGCPFLVLFFLLPPYLLAAQSAYPFISLFHWSTVHQPSYCITRLPLSWARWVSPYKPPSLSFLLATISSYSLALSPYLIMAWSASLLYPITFCVSPLATLVPTSCHCFAHCSVLQSSLLEFYPR